MPSKPTPCPFLLTHTPLHLRNWVHVQKILLPLLLNNGGLHLRSLSIMVMVVMFLPGKNMAGDVTWPERTKVSVPSTKSSSTIPIIKVWIVPLLVPATNTSLVLCRRKSSISGGRWMRMWHLVQFSLRHVRLIKPSVTTVCTCSIVARHYWESDINIWLEDGKRCYLKLDVNRGWSSTLIHSSWVLQKLHLEHWIDLCVFMDVKKRGNMINDYFRVEDGHGGHYIAAIPLRVTRKCRTLWGRAWASWYVTDRWCNTLS